MLYIYKTKFDDKSSYDTLISPIIDDEVRQPEWLQSVESIVEK